MKLADDLSGAKWPFGGYAPGFYTSRCADCGEPMELVAKHATQCLACAIDEFRNRPGAPIAVLEAAPEQTTLRDQFAMTAMRMFPAPKNLPESHAMARALYAIADAMMEARALERGE